MKELNKDFWFKTAFLFFVIGALMGLLMRYYAVFYIDGMDYGFMRQGHSHVAFLGWGYLALVTLLVIHFLPSGSIKKRKYKWNLVFTAITVAGMIFSFPLSGYKAVSITLLILFLIASCVFVFHFLKDFKSTQPAGSSRLFIYAAFFFYLLSGIGPFALGPIVILLGKTNVYYLAVYYYLHFLYNGFFVFAIFGLLMKWMESLELSEGMEKYGTRFFWVMFIACIPAYALSALWVEPPLVLYYVGGIAAVLQVIALGYFWPFVQLVKKKFSGLKAVVFWTVLLSYCLKVIFQLLSAFPVFASKSFDAKGFVIIGYIHLVVLGFISLFLLLWIIKSGSFKLNAKLSKYGLILFLLGIFLSELILFSKGLLQWLSSGGLMNFHELLFVVSTLMPLGLLGFWAGQSKNRVGEALEEIKDA